MKKVFIPLAFLLILILLFTGCGKATTTTTSTSTTPSIMPPVSSATTSATPTATATPTQEIKKGGTLRYLYGLSPQSTPGWPGDTANFQKIWTCFTVFEALVKQDGGGLPIPYLATNREWAADKSSITFTLRQGVKFHDGTPFNAEAVKLDFDQLMADKNSATVNWDRWEIKDDYTITLYLKKYQTDFWASISNWACFIVSPTVLKQGVEYTKEHPVGTGPFKYESFKIDVSLTFVKNPDYW